MAKKKNLKKILLDEDIIDIQQNDIVIVRGTDYKVMKTEPDGTGITEIRLKLA